MNDFGLTFHHLGLAVSDPQKAITFLTAIGYSIGEEVYDRKQNVKLRMCIADKMPDIELIYSTGSPGPVSNILKHSSECFYHICYESQSVTSAIEVISVSGNRVICISEPKAAVLFGNRKVGFYYISGFGVIEILEASK